MGKPKRDVRIYLENLEGMRTYAVSRMMLLGFEVALVPIDQTTVDLLVHYEVLPEDMKPSALTELFAKKFKSDRARQMHFALVAATDAFHNSGRAEEARIKREATKKPRGAAATSAEHAKTHPKPVAKPRAKTSTKPKVKAKPKAKATARSR